MFILVLSRIHCTIPFQRFILFAFVAHTKMPIVMISTSTGLQEDMFFCPCFGCRASTLGTVQSEGARPPPTTHFGPIYDTFRHRLWSAVLSIVRGATTDPKPATDAWTREDGDLYARPHGTFLRKGSVGSNSWFFSCLPIFYGSFSAFPFHVFHV